MNRYLEKINESKYLTLVPTNEDRDKIKKHDELLSKIRNLIRSIAKNSHKYNEKCMKTKFNSEDELHLNKTIETPTMTKVVQAVFQENSKYYP